MLGREQIYDKRKNMCDIGRKCWLFGDDKSSLWLEHRPHNGDGENEEYGMMLGPICQKIHDIISYLSAYHLKTQRAIRDLLFSLDHGKMGKQNIPEQMDAGIVVYSSPNSKHELDSVSLT